MALNKLLSFGQAKHLNDKILEKHRRQSLILETLKLYNLEFYEKEILQKEFFEHFGYRDIGSRKPVCGGP